MLHRSEARQAQRGQQIGKWEMMDVGCRDGFIVEKGKRRKRKLGVKG